MVWLGILKRLPTNDRTARYTGRSMSCQLCHSYLETFDHLFFSCDYSRIIVRNVMSLGQWDNFPLTWDEIIGFLTSFQGTTLSRNIMCLSIALSLYKIWEARNCKLHQNSITPPIVLSKDIINIIKTRLSSCKSFTKVVASRHYYCNWLIS